MLFDRFRQADSSSTRSHGGLGIGLTIVQYIVELHGGSVRVQSAGKRPRLDIYRDPAGHRGAEGDGWTRSAGISTGRPAAPTEAESDLTGIQVLLVDDESDARELIGRVLERAQASVRTAGSVAEALTAFQDRRPDVLITDLAMPQRDGYELIGIIRQLPPHQGGASPRWP